MKWRMHSSEASRPQALTLSDIHLEREADPCRPSRSWTKLIWSIFPAPLLPVVKVTRHQQMIQRFKLTPPSHHISFYNNYRCDLIILCAEEEWDTRDDEDLTINDAATGRGEAAVVAGTAADKHGGRQWKDSHSHSHYRMPLEKSIQPVDLVRRIRLGFVGEKQQIASSLMRDLTKEEDPPFIASLSEAHFLLELELSKVASSG